MKFYHLLFFFLTSCGALTLFSPVPAPIQPRPIQYLSGSSFHPEITNGLSNEDRGTYYHFDEGIQWLPTDVMLSLKRPSSNVFKVMDELLLAKPERFGLLPNYIDVLYPNQLNPQADIPLGITISTNTDYVPMSGISCSSCHTTIISNSEGHFFLVDGAPSRFAVDRFVAEMVKSLAATLANPVEFEAFYERFKARLHFGMGESYDRLILLSSLRLKDHPDLKALAPVVEKAFNTNDCQELQTKLSTISNPITYRFQRFTTLDSAYPTYAMLGNQQGMYFYLVKRFIFLLEQTKYGTADKDSLVAESGLGRANPWSVAKKLISDKYFHLKNAVHVEGGPVSTPYMWDYDRQTWVFWSGTTNSMLERNLAQCTTLLTDFNEKTYETTCSVKKLQDISYYAQKIQAPKWPEAILGSIDTDKANKGKIIFQDKCLNCHDPKASYTLTGTASYTYISVGTDPNYIQGQLELINKKDIFTGMIAPWINHVKEVAALQIEGLIYIDLLNYENGRLPATWRSPELNRIEAKPLAGVWATAPYLHNGSVPTIWDLLQPVDQRPHRFHIGGFVYDTKKLGYIGDENLPDGFEFEVNCLHCQGNSNQGHEFGTELSSEDKWNLIEFLKSYNNETTFK